MTCLEANRVVLDDLFQRSIKGEVDSKSQVVGRVEIRDGTKVENSTIRGPVSIAEKCYIRNSFIGPFTSIGAGTKIEDSSIEHSVILEDCHICRIERLGDSLLGREVEVNRSDNQPRTLKLFAGDNAKLEL